MTTKLDPRCPRKLTEYPDKWCPLAVLRLKALRNAGQELTEKEEARLPGCPWAVNHQLACYCFFSYVNQYMDCSKPPSEAEVAHMLNVTPDMVKRTQKRGVDKIRNIKQFKQIRELHADEQIIPDDPSDDFNIVK